MGKLVIAERFTRTGTMPKMTKPKSHTKQDPIRQGRPRAGDSRPAGPSPKVQASVPAYDRERLREAAQNLGIAETDVVRKALAYYLDLIEKKDIDSL